MRWNHAVSYFFGGVFLSNTLPHLINGVSGNPFQSPFAHPPGEGLSSAVINVGWGLANLLVSYLLLCRVGTFNVRNNRHAILFGLGFAAMSFMAALAFGRFHGGVL